MIYMVEVKAAPEAFPVTCDWVGGDLYQCGNCSKAVKVIAEDQHDPKCLTCKGTIRVREAPNRG